MIDKERQKIIYEDLCSLRDEWFDDINDSFLRRTGVTLRKLLVDGLLITVWNEIKDKKISPSFEIVNTDKILKNFATDEVEFYLSGGADRKGGLPKALLITKGTIRPLTTPIVIVPYKKFIYSGCIQFKEKMGVSSNGLPAKQIKINNLELIKYVCNRIGGAHYNKGIDDTKLMDKYKQLDHLHNNENWLDIDIFGLDPIYFQFLSIGQTIIRSVDIVDLLKELKHIIS